MHCCRSGSVQKKGLDVALWQEDERKINEDK